MKFEGRHRVFFINLLIAAAVSLIVNFPQFLFSLQGYQPRYVRFEVQNPQLLLWSQVLYWFVFALILLSITTRPNREQRGDFMRKVLYSVLVSALAYLFVPTPGREGEIIVIAATPRIFNPMILLKCSLTLIVALLYGKIYELLYHRQKMAMENEQLRSENLLTRYNMLVGQINPHFFFNSLNSLSMLVRSGDNDKSLTYIDRLSDTFRYILQHGQNEVTTLGRELEFLSGYKYLNEVRYADKLFIDIRLQERYLEWRLPVLSLQPLLENAVKHNAITHSRPLRVTISADGGRLVVSNPIIPKMVAEQGTGIGLENLSSRYVLLTGHDIEVDNDGRDFTVRLPMMRPLDGSET